MIRGAVLLILAALGACAPAPASSSGTSPLSTAKVLHVDTEHGVVVVDRGEKDGIRAGVTFDLFRPAETGMLPLGKAVFEKYLGQGTTSKLRIVSGEIQEMSVDDIALYLRKE